MDTAKQFVHSVRVAYADTDAAGVVYHASYFRYLESARIEFLRHHGVEYRYLERCERLALPVIEASIRYKRPAFFDDALDVELWVGMLSKSRVRFDSRITRDGELLTQSEIVLACVQLPDGRPRSIPESVHTACSRGVLVSSYVTE